MNARTSPIIGAMALLMTLACCSLAANVFSHAAASTLMNLCDTACNDYSAVFNPFHH